MSDDDRSETSKADAPPVKIDEDSDGEDLMDQSKAKNGVSFPPDDVSNLPVCLTIEGLVFLDLRR